MMYCNDPWFFKFGSNRTPGSKDTIHFAATREHLLKECITWRKEIRTLWKEVGQAGDKEAGRERVGKGRKGFWYRVRSGPGPTLL